MNQHFEFGLVVEFPTPISPAPAPQTFACATDLCADRCRSVLIVAVKLGQIPPTRTLLNLSAARMGAKEQL